MSSGVWKYLKRFSFEDDFFLCQTKFSLKNKIKNQNKFKLYFEFVSNFFCECLFRMKFNTDIE
ncbi:hypothetical protein BpHYR1_052758 [Brachionus plicatilis]|uniref:Uncharacterized protein n=1 Tax=Brachionus plicatilis TaxID=10195 RepID=A0A3M7PQY5_BRAPC|nr:hypothetical protein BpHYR1_052758 [Brachionus plicatilis]